MRLPRLRPCARERALLMRTSLSSPWRELAAKAGGVDALAQELHVSRRTLFRWSQGGEPKMRIIRDHVLAFFRRRGLASPWS
jgi:hypothetical protein